MRAASSTVRLAGGAKDCVRAASASMAAEGPRGRRKSLDDPIFIHTFTHISFTARAHSASEYYRTRRKARCPIGTDQHVSPGRW
eukprot:3737421-Prymnesium_polylepis.1